jgi:hypothetical protein
VALIDEFQAIKLSINGGKLHNSATNLYPRVLSHSGLAIYIKKYLKAKERRIMETQIFHHAKI